jgi:hypothetical protein
MGQSGWMLRWQAHHVTMEVLKHDWHGCWLFDDSFLDHIVQGVEQ